MAATTNQVTFTPREMEVLALAWQCIETQPKIDMVKLASLTGYTVGSAGVTFGKIKQKIKLLSESLGNGNTGNMPSTPKKTAKSKSGTPASGTPRKRKGTAETFATPSKKSKNVDDEEGQGDDDFEDIIDVSAGVKKEEEEEESLDNYEGANGYTSFLEGIEGYAVGGGK